MSDVTSFSSSSGESRKSGERISRYRSATYSQASLARLLLAEQACELADAARDLVPTTSDVHAADGEFVKDSTRLVETAHRLLEAAVVYEHLRGTTWESIGVALGEVGHQAAHERYGQVGREFQQRFLHAWLRPERAHEIFTTADDLARFVAHLDAWVVAHRELDEIDHGDQPVTAGLRPMSIAERSALITQTASQLQVVAADPGADVRGSRELEIGLCRRSIELYEDLIVQSPGDPDALTALAGARARLAVLQADEAAATG